MPQIIRLDSNLRNGGVVAERIGDYNTERDNQQYGLQLDHAGNSGQRARIAIMEDMTRRDLGAQQIAAQDARLATQGDQRLAVAGAQGTNAMARTQAQIDAANGRATEKNAIRREGMDRTDARFWDGTMPQRWDANDATRTRDANANDDRDAQRQQQADLAAQREAHADRMAQVKAAADAATRDQKLTAEMKQKIVAAAVREAQHKRSFAFNWMNSSYDPVTKANAKADFDRYTNMIDDLNKSLGQPGAPATQPAAPGGFDAPTNAVAPSYAQPPVTDLSQQVGGDGGGGGVVQVQTVQEALSLPPGTVFMTPDGRVKVRP